MKIAKAMGEVIEANSVAILVIETALRTLAEIKKIAEEGQRGLSTELGG